MKKSKIAMTNPYTWQKFLPKYRFFYTLYYFRLQGIDTKISCFLTNFLTLKLHLFPNSSIPILCSTLNFPTI